MSAPTTYEGSCHCGGVRYQVAMEAPTKAYACNCSICRRDGSLNAFVSPEQFTLLAGEDLLRDYQFGKRTIHHLFCGTCGNKSFSRGVDAEGREGYAINLRCVPVVDLTDLPVESFDGASL